HGFGQIFWGRSRSSRRGCIAVETLVLGRCTECMGHPAHAGRCRKHNADRHDQSLERLGCHGLVFINNEWRVSRGSAYEGSPACSREPFSPHHSRHYFLRPVTEKEMMAKKNHFAFIVVCSLLLTIWFFLNSPAAATGTASVVIIGNIVYPPVAQFTSDVTVGAAPLSVHFTDQSTHVPASWYWDFGDGTNSTDQNPAHTYASGIYTVNLTVKNAAGTSTNVSEKYITAYASQKTLTYTPPAGLTGTAAVSLNISQVTTSGGIPSLSGNALTLTYPAGSAFSQMTINLNSASTSNGDISGTVSSVALQTTPVSGTLLNIQLNSLPSAGTAITSTIIQGTDTSSNDKFQTFAASNGLSLVNTNYELVVSDNIPSSSIANAVITMEVPGSWYSTYGSNTVRVMRLDSGGSVSMLDTTFSGFDGSNAVYTARSPYGLSIFAIISLQGSTTSSQSQPSSGSGSGTDSGIAVQVAGKGPQQPAQQIPQPQVQPVQPAQKPEQVLPGGQEKNLLAPAEGSLVSQTIDLSPFSQYMYTDASGNPGATIDRNK